jgi:glyoxylase-like metal-dependent hydrolase (beta-lactamase superfamily II)
MYEIYALMGSETEEDSSITYYQARSDKKTKKAFYFFCLKNNKGQAILLDTGIASSELKAMGITGRPDREELLHTIGVNPDDVEAVILSHIHGDHFSDPEIYHNAIFYLQRSEYQFWNEEIQRFHKLLYPPIAGGKPVVDIETLRKLNSEKRVRFLDGDTEIYPGIRGIWCGAHSPGSQCVAVETNRGQVLYCGDFICNYRNLDEEIPVGVLTSLVEWLRGIGKIEQMRLPRESIIPGHDPGIMNMFPKISSEVVKIA